MDSNGRDILQGWKEIADYVSRDERTVKRWEKQRQLPVRRMPGKGRANVFVRISELDSWLSQSPSSGAAAVQAVPVLQPPPWHRLWAAALQFGVPLLALLCLGVIAVTLRAHRTPVTAVASAYHASHVSGVEDLYLRGVYSYERRTPGSLAAADQLLRQALVKDAAYAPAWSALAITHLLAREYGSMPDAEAYARARAEAQRAIALASETQDPRLSDPYAALAFVDFFWDEHPAAAERDFQTALRINPASVLAHQWYGSVLIHEGRFTEALQHLDTAQRLEPNSTAVLATRAYALGYSGHRDQALDMLKAITEEDSDYSSAHFRIAVLCMAPPADPACSLRERRLWATRTHNEAQLDELAFTEPAYRSGGEPAMWQAALQWQRARHPQGGVMGLAVAEAALGRYDDALTDIEKVAARHDPLIMGINMNIQLRPLHRDPRFQRVRASIGLPQVP